MQYAKMKIIDRVWFSETNQDDMENIVLFLEDMGWDSTLCFREWLIDKEFKELETNKILLFRREDKMVIGFKYSDDFDAYSSEVAIIALVDLLHQWENMCKKPINRLVELHITYDGTLFDVQPEFISTVQVVWRQLVERSKKKIKKVIKFGKLLQQKVMLLFRKKKVEKITEIIGFHYDFNNIMKDNDEFKGTHEIICLATGCVRQSYLFTGHIKARARTALFPTEWEQEKFAEKLQGAMENEATKPFTHAGILSMQVITEDNMFVEIIFSLEGELLSAYPIMQKN